MAEDHYRRKDGSYPDVIPTPDEHRPVRKDPWFRGRGRRPRTNKGIPQGFHPISSLRKTVPTRKEITPREDIPGVLVREAIGFLGETNRHTLTTTNRFLRVTSAGIIQVRANCPMILHVGRRPSFRLQECRKYEILIVPQQTVTLEAVLNYPAKRVVEAHPVGPLIGPIVSLGPFFSPNTIDEYHNYGLRRLSGVAGPTGLYEVLASDPDNPGTEVPVVSVSPLTNGSFIDLPAVHPMGFHGQYRVRYTLFAGDVVSVDDNRWYFGPTKGCFDDQKRNFNAPADVELYSDGREFVDAGL